MGSISNKIKFSALGAILVPCFGRLALHGTGSEYDFYRYFVPLFVGGLAGYLIGLMRDILVSKNQDLQIANEGLKKEINERNKAENELQLKDLVFEAAITANSTADTKGYLTHVNNAFVKTWGFENKEEVVGKHISEFIKFEEEAEVIITALNETGDWAGEYTALKNNRTTFVANGLATIIKDKSGNVIGYQSSVIDITDRIQKERERENLISELQAALKKIQQLNGLLPLCSYCKKVRDDKGYWNQIDAYIEEHSEVDVSHSICPECADKYYPDMNLYDDE